MAFKFNSLEMYPVIVRAQAFNRFGFDSWLYQLLACNLGQDPNLPMLTSDLWDLDNNSIYLIELL